jgi:hypothetical protein
MYAKKKGINLQLMVGYTMVVAGALGLLYFIGFL